MPIIKNNVHMPKLLDDGLPLLGEGQPDSPIDSYPSPPDNPAL